MYHSEPEEIETGLNNPYGKWKPREYVSSLTRHHAVNICIIEFNYLTKWIQEKRMMLGLFKNSNILIRVTKIV